MTLRRMAALGGLCGGFQAITFFASLMSAVAAHAQVLPSRPIVVGNRLTIGADLSASFGCAHSVTPKGPGCGEDLGFFNYTDYEHSLLRMLRVDVAASFEASRHFSVLGEVRTENAGEPRIYALYARIRPWAEHRFDIQVGRIPPTFGTFSRRTYAADNLLIGYPLAYQYLTSLRADALPASADQLLEMRGRGWLSSFRVGNLAPAPGVPLVNAFRWDTGVQAQLATERVDVAAAITAGTLANPRVSDDNDGKQVAARAVFRPWPELTIGVSAARGPFVSTSAATAAGTGGNGSDSQVAWEGDIEVSRGHYLVRFETITSRWRVPTLESAQLPLTALSIALEGRYRLTPRLYAAGRTEHLGFSEVTGTLRRDSWDAPVTRVEVGGGYALTRNVTVKLSFQHNRRPAGRVTHVDAVGAQIGYWF